MSVPSTLPHSAIRDQPVSSEEQYTEVNQKDTQMGGDSQVSSYFSANVVIVLAECVLALKTHHPEKFHGHYHPP